MTTAAVRAWRLLVLLLFLVGLNSLAGGSASGAVLVSGFSSGHSTVVVARSDSSEFVVTRERAVVARRLSLAGRRARCALSSSSSFGPSFEGIARYSSLRSRNGGRGAFAQHWCVVNVRTGHSAERRDVQSSWAGSPKATARYAYEAPPAATTFVDFVATNTVAGHSVDDLVAAGEAADRNGLTAAGRALQKHGARADSVFPEVTGGPNALNPDGREVLEGILNDPAKTVVSRSHPSLGEIVDVRAPTGRGARFTKDGRFIGFLDPGRKP